MKYKEVSIKGRLGSMFIDHFAWTFVSMIIIVSLVINDSISNNRGINAEEFNLVLDEFSPKFLYNLFLVLMLLYLNKDAIQGRSLGKRLIKHQVIEYKTGSIANPFKCFIRNILTPVWPIEVIAILINPERKIGDFIAGTKVVSYKNEKINPIKIDWWKILYAVFVGIVLYVGCRILIDLFFTLV